jgi:hypothetical protein
VKTQKFGARENDILEFDFNVECTRDLAKTVLSEELVLSRLIAFRGFTQPDIQSAGAIFAYGSWLCENAVLLLRFFRDSWGDR